MSQDFIFRACVSMVFIGVAVLVIVHMSWKEWIAQSRKDIMQDKEDDAWDPEDD